MNEKDKKNVVGLRDLTTERGGNVYIVERSRAFWFIVTSPTDICPMNIWSRRI